MLRKKDKYFALYPLLITTTDTGSAVLIDTSEDWTVTYDTDKSNPNWGLQLNWSGLVSETATLGLQYSVDGINYSNYLDDNGDAISVTLTTAAPPVNILNTLPIYGTFKVTYTHDDIEDGSVWLNLIYGG